MLKTTACKWSETLLARPNYMYELILQFPSNKPVSRSILPKKLLQNIMKISKALACGVGAFIIATTSQVVVNAADPTPAPTKTTKVESSTGSSTNAQEGYEHKEHHDHKDDDWCCTLSPVLLAGGASDHVDDYGKDYFDKGYGGWYPSYGNDYNVYGYGYGNSDGYGYGGSFYDYDPSGYDYVYAYGYGQPYDYGYGGNYGFGYPYSYGDNYGYGHDGCKKRRYGNYFSY